VSDQTPNCPRCPKCGGEGEYVLVRPGNAGRLPSAGHPYLRGIWAVWNLGKLAAGQVCRCKNCKHVWPAWRWV
jgi:hypothetical protein